RGVGGGAGRAERAWGGRPATEEGLEHVAEPTETGEAVACGGRVLQRIATGVDNAALLRVAQHLVGYADLLEPGLGLFVGVDVGVQFTGELPIGALDLRIAGPPAHPEQPVVVACHA